MDASFFAPVADLLAPDHTVLTTDPRGIRRSRLEDPDQDLTPDMCAEDLSHILTQLDAGPAVVFGSSGGGLNVLALALAHPEQVSAVITHEPPLLELLEDREQQRAATEDVVATFRTGDVGAAWGRFMMQANIDIADGPPPPPPGAPDPQAVADERFFFTHWLRPATRWLPDVAALRDGAPPIVVGIGEASAGQICDRTSSALAGALGIERTVFPGGHAGFVEDPDAFAARLRTVIGG
jgi:pimeloyl-ACP methyl ester carboxylesterase